MKTGRIHLTEALKEWCDPELVRRVETEERCHSAYEMNNSAYFQLTPQTQRSPTARYGWKVGADFSDLRAAWHDLKQDFRNRILRGQIFLEGIQTKPERRTHPEPIPSVWAGDFEFDFAAQAVWVDGLRYGAVTCSRKPPQEIVATDPGASDPAAAPKAVAAITLHDLPLLSDDMVLALLEDHARRVVEGPDGRFIAQDKPSLMPIILRRMQYHATQNTLRNTLADECAELHRWIKEKVPSHQAPSASSIENALRQEYWKLRPQ